MKGSQMSKGCFAAIELILRDIALDKSEIPLEKLLEMMQDQIDMIRQIEGINIGNSDRSEKE